MGRLWSTIKLVSRFASSNGLSLRHHFYYDQYWIIIIIIGGQSCLAKSHWSFPEPLILYKDQKKIGDGCSICGGPVIPRLRTRLTFGRLRLFAKDGFTKSYSSFKDFGYTIQSCRLQRRSHLQTLFKNINRFCFWTFQRKRFPAKRS